MNLNNLNYKFAYIPNKFWGVNSILVPKTAPIIDDSFKDLGEIFKDNEKLFTNIYWNAINVVGEVKLPGEWNYCYLNDKGYHLIKTKSDGEYEVGKGEWKEFFYYQLIYDDWVNEFLTNSINVSGNIIKTGDMAKVRENIHRTTPIIQNVNHLDEFDCASVKQENKWTFKVPSQKFYEDNSFYWLHPVTIMLLSRFLKNDYERNFDGNEGGLKLPFLAQEIKSGNWKTALATSIVEYINTGMAIYDASRINLNYSSFITKYRVLSSDDVQDNQIYVLTKVKGPKQVADTYVRGMWLNEVDLSGLTDIKELKPDFTDVDTTIERSWRSISDKMFKKILGGDISELSKYKNHWDELVFASFNATIIKFGGRLLSNVEADWKEIIAGKIAGEKEKDFGFYTNVEIKKKENQWDRWVYRGKKLNLYWWIGTFPIGEYLTGNRYQKNHIIYRNVSPQSGSLFMGAGKKNSTITKKVQGKSYSAWRNNLGRNERPEALGEIDARVDSWWQYNDNFLGLSFFDFNNDKETAHRVRALIHMDLYKLEENRGGRITEIEPYRGVTLIPDYENTGYVLAEYETLTENIEAKKTGGSNSVLAIKEILDHTNPVKNYDINTPDEKLLTMKEWQKVSHAIRLGTLIKRLLLPPEEGHKQAKIRYKKWYWDKPGDTDGYTELNEYEYFIECYIPNIPKRWNWRITVPVNCAIDIMKILEKYRDISDNNLAYFNGKTKESKGINNYRTYFYPVFDLNQADFLNTKKYDELTNKEIENTIYIFIDVHPKTTASETEKVRIKKLLEEVHTAFFRSPWSEDVTYQSTNIPGNVKKWVYTETNGEKINYWSLSNLRPYRGLWYSSRILIKQRAVKDLGEIESWYEQRKEENIFTFGWSSYGKNSMYLRSIDKSFEYKDDENIWITWKEYLNNLYIMGQADKLEDSPHGIITRDFIDFQEREGYAWHWRNSNKYLNIRTEQQKKLGESFICMETIKNKSITFEDKNNENPKTYHHALYREKDPNKIWGFYNKQDQQIPEYVWKYIDPDSPISALHNLEQYKHQEKFTLDWLQKNIFTKIEKSIIDLHNFLRGSPTYFDLVGTNFLALGTYDDNHNWNFEFIPKTNSGVLVKEGRKKCVFTNFKTEEDTTIKAINSLTELNVYGHKIPLKERFTIDGLNIPIHCEIDKIHDKFQSPADWFYLEIKSKTDFIRTQIEVPKEKTISSNMTLQDKQRLFNEYLYNNADRYWENQKYIADKDNFFRSIKREEKYQYHDIAGDIIGGFAGMAGNVLSLKALGGPGSIIPKIGFGLGFVNSIYQGIVGHQKRSEERTERLIHGTKTFQIQGETMAVKHRSAEEVDKMTIMNLSNNNRYPEFNNAIIFEELNKLIGKTNIYLSRYSPSGDLLQMLKDHYDEYGFDIFLTNQNCTGIESINNVIQFQTIKKNIHKNTTIRDMIEQRLLTGVKIITT